ncbi:MAG: ABC transporter ATP-binding protein [Cytophagales bacterium]|nr:ABC transporter ATP-binding protein [Cytophagales bacterium]
MAEDKEHSGKILDLQILKKIFVFVKPYKSIFYLIIAITVISGILTPIRPKLIQHSIDYHILIPDFQGLINMCALLFGLLIMQGILDYFNTYYASWLGQNIIKDVRQKLFAHLMKHKTSFYDKTPVGRLITRNVSDVETISDIFTEGIAEIAAAVLQIIFIVAMMLYANVKLTLISLSVIPFLLISTYIFKEKVKTSFNDVRTAVANLNTFVQEHITGMSIVQIFNSEQREYDKFAVINKEHRDANLRSVLYYSIYFPVAEVLSAAGVGLLVWWGAQGVLHEEVTLGTLVAFIMYINMFFRPIREIADKFNTLQMGIVGSSRVLKILHTDSDIQQTGNIAGITLQGNIAFNNVWFAYNDEQYVLKDITFEVKAGQTVALVGATGAGKSSIINLISRFYEINQGSITIDGKNINDYQLAFLRRQIGMVQQDVFLFSQSILQNITLGNPDINLDEVVKAAKMVGAHDFIDKLPGKYDYNVMERGATLSVGQRQLISFVRAMVYNPKILVLDEATSSVDSETEELIQSAITKLLQGRTSIVIAHRLSTIQHADKIIVLDHGKIMETGTHDELLMLNGYYANLCKMQFDLVV